MGPAISEILPYALGIAISPIPIIGVILILFSARARVNGPAFLLGWILGLALVCLIVTAFANALDVGTDSSASDGASTFKVALGIFLILGAIRKWRSRPAPGAEVELPTWMATIDSFTPVKAIGLGALFSGVNPKCLIFGAAAASTVAQANLSTTDTVITLAVFIALSSLTIIIPIAYALIGGESARTTLEGWKAWLSVNNAAVMAVLFLVFGVVLLSQGLGPITA
ncbi:MAG: GAP family protein [Acidimicrobiia bacterium]|nr:GAP family protein [Acidimicrobiia bacterium]